MDIQAPWNVSRLVELRCLLPISLYDLDKSSLGVLTTTNGPQGNTLKLYGHREQRTVDHQIAVQHMNSGLRIQHIDITEPYVAYRIQECYCDHRHAFS